MKGLNRILQGFKNYYRLSPIGQKWLGKIDWYVLERLNLFWNKKRNVRKKNIGKPYEGEPHVRFDEEKLEQKRDGEAISKKELF